METPLFTVVTVTYNSARWVRLAIESVLNSDFRDFEYIIADDCSTDDTWSIILEYKDPRIRAWRNEKNIGEYPNRNNTIRQARGRYLLFIDGDDILYKYTLRNLKEYIHAFPEAIMIWGVPSTSITFAVLPYQFEPTITMRLIYETHIPLAIIGFPETVFRVDMLKKIGYLPTKYAIGDTYIKKRLALEGPVLMVPMGFAFWRLSEEQASRRASKSFRGFLEGFEIDIEILTLSSLANKIELLQKVKGSFIRRLIKHTLFKGKLSTFFRLYRASALTFGDLRYVFKRFNNQFTPVNLISEPLQNDFHFKNRANA